LNCGVLFSTQQGDIPIDAKMDSVWKVAIPFAWMFALLEIAVLYAK
jgi:hypothetical protein